MKKDKHALFPWLVDEIHQVKAHIKYEIKLAEASLHQLMGREPQCGGKTQAAVEYCTKLQKQYKNLSDCISSGLSDYYNRSELAAEKDISCCYLKIDEARQQLLFAISVAEEINAISALMFYYKNLESLLTALLSPINTQLVLERSKGLSYLVDATTLQAWLAAVVKFAHDGGENTALHKVQLTQLDDNSLLSIYKLFIKTEYVALINALFFYKIHPQRLYSQALHPEKQISVRIRLELLYSFIELIQETVLQTLRHRGFAARCDYLFHGDGLPEGISFEVEGDCQELIAATIKTWRLTHMRYQDAKLTRGKLEDLFSAYKFWFNPNRLIDTVMSLRIHLIGSITDEEGYKLFSAQMIFLYQQLTTVQCIDLYGYFSNKDSCYLMRTLSAAFSGYEKSKLPLLTINEKNAVRDVYLNLDCVMNSLRDELKNRQISTTPYSRDKCHKFINPGRRNLQALKRVTELYCENKRETNQLLEQLFAEIES